MTQLSTLFCNALFHFLKKSEPNVAKCQHLLQGRGDLLFSVPSGMSEM